MYGNGPWNTPLIPAGYPCASRGGDYNDSGSDNPASYRNGVFTTFSDSFIGFRASLFK